ncbi:MAG: hypothetical protein A4S12_13960 [Proteobacteria bacterium SG_bin5]|nr:uracil-DNA glycosylase [Sphingomonas sp.]OQW42702.1 MAG: hypothetical protein A4S12_13960 [Proteobacteria bacterium SG_bin5]
MGADQHLDWAFAKSALDWWRDAGVDVLVEDAPRDWLAPAPIPPLATPSAAPRVAPPLDTDRASTPDVKLPETLDAFLAWRLSDAAPEAGWGTPLLAPEGPADARLMVLVECPERDAPEALLGGAAGRLFDAMLAAIGLDRSRIHLAALAWGRPLAGRLPSESSARLAALARHHVSLVAPERLLLFGNAASRALLGVDVMGARGSLQPLNHRIGNKAASAVASFPPRFLLERPAAKAEAWRDLQLLTGGWA